MPTKKPRVNAGRRLRTRPLGQAIFGPRKDTVVVWLGMAGVLINTRGTVLLIDPLLTSAPRAPGVEDAETGHHLNFRWPIRARQVPRVDAVLYTHSDADHFGMVTAHTLGARLKPPFFAPPRVLAWLKEMGMDCELTQVREKQTFRIGAAEVVVTPALHDYPCDYPFRRADCCGFLVKTPDGDIWHPGDSRLIKDLRKFRCDLIFFDIAAVDAHLGPAGSAELAKSAGAKVMVPYHYGTFDMPRGSWGGCTVEDALPAIKKVKGLSAHLHVTDPGQPIGMSKGEIKL